MDRPFLRLLALGAAFSVACVDDVRLPASTEGVDPAAQLAVPSHCPSTSDAPQTLECTGLYRNLLAKEVEPAVRVFSPAVHLWSDGAEKQRWIYLPPGATIDSSQGTAWSFPVNTRAWKEFKHKGQRIETRFFHKVAPDKWLTATYLWRDNETAADLYAGGDVPVPDGAYHVPTHDECDQCHRGRKDRLLGFETVLLGMPGAEGVTLADLASEGKLSVPPSRTTYEIPDDGTGAAAPALAWLHVNCGVSCHNDYPNSKANPSGLFLRIDPAYMEGTPLAEWNPVKTTVNAKAFVVNFLGETRIVPGRPDDSLIVKLAETRGSSRAMPPIASRLLDEEGIKLIREWITRLGGPAPLDAGAPDGGPPDAASPTDGFDAGPPAAPAADAQTPDTGDPDAGEPDAGEPDAQVPDAGTAETDSAVPPDPSMVDAGSPAPTELDAQSIDALTQDGALADAELADVALVDAESADTSAADVEAADGAALEASSVIAQ